MSNGQTYNSGGAVNINVSSTTGNWTTSGGCTGVIAGGGFAINDPGVTIFCDKPEHKMYRAIREACPCFKDASAHGGVKVTGEDDKTVELREASGDLFLIESDGLARSFLQLFERVREQEIMIAEMQNEIDELRKKRDTTE